jgi:hypothetical protein
MCEGIMKQCYSFFLCLLTVSFLQASKGQTVDNARLHLEVVSANHFSILDTLFSFPAPGTFPTGLAWDGQYFWHADYNQNRIYKLTPTGAVVSFFDLPFQVGSPAGIEWDGASLWVVNEALGRAFILDTSGTLLRSFGLPDSAAGDPQSWGLAWDGDFMWHSQYEFEARIFKLDPSTGQVLSSFVPPTHLILDIAWANGFLFGADLSTRLLYKMDPVNGTVVATESWQVPYPLGLTWDGSYFWNASGPPSLGRRRIYQVSSSIVTSTDNQPATAPRQFTLEQNYPNPFNPTTNLRYSMPERGFVSLKVFDLLGREVATLVNEELSPGKHEVTWDASGTPSGVYVSRLISSGRVETRKLIVLK